LGHRTAMLISKSGVKEEELDSFILDLYNRLIDLGLSPENIAFHIKDLLEFSRANSDIVVPLSQITQYIQQKTEEKNKLEQEIQTLKYQIKTLNEEKANSEQRRNSALYREHTTDAELRSYSDLTQELGHYGIPVYDISKFAKAVKGLSYNGYDADKIIAEYSQYEAFRDDYFSYKSQIPDLQMKCSQLQEWTNHYTQRLSLIDKLQGIGFDFKQLKSLWHTIVEIAEANNISREDAVKRFITEINDHYDDILGLKSKKHELEAEINDLGSQKLKLVAYLNAFSKFGGPFEKLLGIMNSTSPEEVSLLIDKLYSVGGVSSAIEKLSAKLTLSVGRDTNDGSIGDNNSKVEKSITSEFAHLSIAYQENSTAGQLTTSDNTAVLPVDSYSQNHNGGNEIAKQKEKVKEAFTEDDDPPLRLLLTEAIDRLPALAMDMEKNKQVKNNDSIYANHQEAERTDK
jgi:predicted  nucleic acid-binding Zn-ribbon protein